MAKLGATGKFPEGKLNEDDEGELSLAVAYDPVSKLVRIDFGKPVAWLAMPPENANAFCNIIANAVRAGMADKLLSEMPDATTRQ